MEGQKLHLPQILSKSTKRILSSCFRKIVVYQHPSDEEDVKHYDLECEGVMIIESILKNKIQSLQMKALEEIKAISKIYQSTTNRRYPDYKSKDFYESSVYSRDNTLRPYITNRYSSYEQNLFENDPSFYVSSLQPQTFLKFHPQQQQQSKYFGYASSHSSTRVKFNNNHQSQNKYSPNKISSRDFKRKMIIEKLNLIEREIHQISTIDEIYSQKSSLVRPFNRQMRNSNILNYDLEDHYSTKRLNDIC